MADHRPPVPPLLAAGVAFVLVSFALNSAVTRWIVHGERLDAALTSIVRFLAGALVLIVLLAARRRTRALIPRRMHVVPALLLGSYAFLISYGYEHIGAAAGTFVFYACVLITMVLGGALIDRERPAPRAMIGGAVALVGLLTLSTGRVENVTLLGVALLAATGASWGAYSLLGRRDPDALGFTAANFVLLGGALVPAAVVVLTVGEPRITAEGVWAAALMGGITTALSYAVWYQSLHSLNRAQAGTYQLAIPVLAALLGIAWLGETASLLLAAAAALVLIGMALATPRRATA